MSHAVELLARFPKHIKVIMILATTTLGEGHFHNLRSKEESGERFYGLENCMMLGNPAFVELNGVKVLMYHGQGLDDIIATTPGLSYSRQRR